MMYLICLLMIRNMSKVFASPTIHGLFFHLIDFCVVYSALHYFPCPQTKSKKTEHFLMKNTISTKSLAVSPGHGKNYGPGCRNRLLAPGMTKIMAWAGINKQKYNINEGQYLEGSKFILCPLSVEYHKSTTLN